MRHLLGAVAILALFIGAGALAADFTTAVPAQSAVPAVSAVSAAAPADAPPTVENLIETAAAKCAAAKDLSAESTTGAVGRVGKGSLKIIFPDRLIFLTEYTEKSGDKNLSVTTVRIVRNKNLLYVEQTGNGVDRPGVVLIDLARVAELRKQRSPLAPRLEAVRPPAYEWYLKDAASEGLIFKVVKADGDLVTVEGANPKFIPGSRQPARVVAVISRSDGFPRSIRHYGELGNLLDFIEFSKVTFDAGLKSSDLDYAPPKDLPLTDYIDYLKNASASSPKK
jgi:hypothetical protein